MHDSFLLIFIGVVNCHYSGDRSTDDEDLINFRSNPEIYAAFYEGIITWTPGTEEVETSGDDESIPDKVMTSTTRVKSTQTTSTVTPPTPAERMSQVYLICAIVAGSVGGVVFATVIICLTAYRLVRRDMGSYAIPNKHHRF